MLYTGVQAYQLSGSCITCSFFMVEIISSAGHIIEKVSDETKNNCVTSLELGGMTCFTKLC